MKCKALHIGREKLNIFGTVLRSKSGSISSVRPVHAFEQLYEDLLSCMCAQKSSIFVHTQAQYKLWGHSHVALIICRVPVCPLPNQFKPAWFQSTAARPTTYRKKLSDDQTYFLYSGVDTIKVSTSMKTFRRRIGIICLSYLVSTKEKIW